MGGPANGDPSDERRRRASMSDERTTEAANVIDRETMAIGEAAALLGLSVAQVRKLCKIYERSPDEGLAFMWTSSWVERTDVNGHRLRGHRRPYRDAVETLAKVKQHAERNPSL
jgi:hypothetical protein